MTSVDSTTIASFAKALGNNYHVAVLGTEGRKDLDLFVLGHEYSRNQCFDSTAGFLPFLSELRTHNSIEVIVRHEHRAFVPRSSHLLHVLFYPSLDHLQTWETPSFLGYVHDRARFLSGNNKVLERAYDDYRRRRAFLSTDLTSFHLLKYSELAVSNLLYLCLKSQLFPQQTYFENLLYFLRFAVIELLTTELDHCAEIDFWDWNEFIAYFTARYPKQGGLVYLFRNRVTSYARFNSESIVKLFLESLKLVDGGLDRLSSLSFNQIVKGKVGKHES